MKWEKKKKRKEMSRTNYRRAFGLQHGGVALHRKHNSSIGTAITNVKSSLGEDLV